MYTKCVPLLADLVLYSYNAEFIKKLLNEKKDLLSWPSSLHLDIFMFSLFMMNHRMFNFIMTHHTMFSLSMTYRTSSFTMLHHRMSRQTTSGLPVSGSLLPTCIYLCRSIEMVYLWMLNWPLYLCVVYYDRLSVHGLLWTV